MPAFDLAAELLAQGLLAVADREDGNPALEDLAGARGLPGSGTDAGPPEKMTALGLSRANASPAFEKG